MAKEKYKNLGGSSGIAEYEIGFDSITVTFSDGSCYLYSNVKPGSEDVEQMKKMARAGQGLNSFISRKVKKNYEKKLR